MTMPYFGHIKDMHGYWSIWCFSIIRCSWNGRSTKLVELISNKHISSISWMKCRYVGDKYMYFMTAKRDVAEYVPLCDTCERVKAEHQWLAGLLQLLHVPEWKWEEIAMDFIMGLLRTQLAYNSIWVIVDRLTTVAHLIPIKTIYSR
jgi:hypothetical protein